MDSSSCIDLINSKASREIWLENKQSKAFAFARSFWYENSTISNRILGDEPVGQSFVKLDIDIYKEINQIYCGYSKLMGIKFHSCHYIWGRHYTIWHNSKPLAIIQEFFSPNLTKHLPLSIIK